MRRSGFQSRGRRFFPKGRNGERSAFTLIEMLVVVVIIGIIASIGIPALKGFGQANATVAASRQLLDDISLARQRAINSRSTVYVVFISPDVVGPVFLAGLSGPGIEELRDRRSVTNLFGGQYTTYALFSHRNVGEQPGRDNPRFLTPWKTLPEGMFISKDKFGFNANRFGAAFTELNRPFAYESIPFPSARSAAFPNPGLPYLAFNARGQLISENAGSASVPIYQDAVIPLARGSIFYGRDRNGNLIAAPADVQETPPLNSVSNYNRIRIDWLTGRAKLERPELR